jgi:hypothetical protein
VGFRLGFRWTQLLADRRRGGRPISVGDRLIAATAPAQGHDLMLGTLNQLGFKPTKVRLWDPSD